MGPDQCQAKTKGSRKRGHRVFDSRNTKEIQELEEQFELVCDVVDGFLIVGTGVEVDEGVQVWVIYVFL